MLQTVLRHPRLFMWRNKVCPAKSQWLKEEGSSGDDNEDKYVPKYASDWVRNPESMKHTIAQQQTLKPFCETMSLESTAEPLANLEFLSDVTNLSRS
jgi:hypothetical protein